MVSNNDIRRLQKSNALSLLRIVKHVAFEPFFKKKKGRQVACRT